MKLCILIAFLLFCSSLQAAPDNLGPNAKNFTQDVDFGPEGEDDIDPKALRKFIEDEGLIQSRNKEGRIIIAGDVRSRWIRTREWIGESRQRGFNSRPQVAVDVYKTEINMIFDYAAPTSWAETKIKYAFLLGKDGGTNTLVAVDRAWIGYEIYEEGEEELYIEVGRNRLDTLFDSKIEFTAVYDGAMLTYKKNIEHLGFFDVHGGPMIVDSYTSHYAWIVEASLKNVLDSGFSFKYSYVNWGKDSVTLYYGNLKSPLPPLIVKNTPTVKGLTFNAQLPDNPRYRFAISQVLVGYEVKASPFRCNKTSWFYAGGLINHDARPILQTNFKKQNLGWFVGYTIGKLKKKCDWSLDVNYQYVQMQAVPDFDLAGIGHGNALNRLFSDSIIDGASAINARGFANYKGYEATGLYALTDSLTLKVKFQHSSPIDSHIGGNFRYDNFEFSAIFAF